MTKNKKSYTAESAVIESRCEEDIVDVELLNWVNLNLDDFEDDYSDEEEGTAMLNSGP